MVLFLIGCDHALFSNNSASCFLMTMAKNKLQPNPFFTLFRLQMKKKNTGQVVNTRLPDAFSCKKFRH